MAFKKPCQKVKTSAPIKASERRKMKQQVMETFSLSAEDGDLLVPDPILSFKFDTHVKQPGVAYTSAEGDPLWFTLGKASTDLIPTVYTLWKKPNLLPNLTTPTSVIPVLVGGADLMIPGVVRKPNDVKTGDLVSITAHIQDPSLVGPPLAVGRMAIDANRLPGDEKGKAVNILHTYEDSLWGLGSKLAPPEPMESKPDPPAVASSGEPTLEKPDPNAQEVTAVLEVPQAEPAALTTAETDQTPLQTLSADEVTSLLRTSAIQAISTQLSNLPPASFPIPSSLLYSSYILPCRPVKALEVGTPVDIKHSSHKNLTSFVKALEKDGLLRLKDFKGDLNILGVQATHPEVRQHKPYRTIGDKEKGDEKRAAEEKLQQEKVKEMLVRELWMPSRSTAGFFVKSNKSTKDLYTIGDLRTIVNEYITQHSLINQNDQQYVNLDEALTEILPSEEGSLKFVKRPDIVKHLCKGMDAWHEITVDGKDPVTRKGALKPIAVIGKTGHRSSTTIKYFEPYFVTAEFLCNELRRICSTSTDASNSGREGPVVSLRGKNIGAVVDLLISQGIPKRYIETSEETRKK